MFKLGFGCSLRTFRPELHRHPRTVLMLTIIFLAGILLGSVPLADPLNPAANGVPVDFWADIVDGSDLDPDEPDEDEDDKLLLHGAASKDSFGKLAWSRANEIFHGAFFSSVRFALPPGNAPPSATA